VAPYAANSKPFARAGLAMIGLAWTLPFLQPFHRFPLPSFYAEWLALVLGIAALAPLLKREAWSNLPLPSASLAALLMIGIAWLQFALGLMPYLGQALAPGIYLLWAALLVLLGDFLRRELGMERVATTLAWFLLAGAAISAVAGVAQHYHLTPLVGTVIAPKRTLQVFGNLSQPNHYAAYCVLGLVALAYLAARGRIAIAVAAPFGALLAFTAAISGSRSVWVYLVVVPLLAWALYRHDPRPGHRRFLLACGALLPAFAVMNAVAGLPWLAPPDVEMTTSLDRLFGQATGISVRLALWQAAWRMFTDAPVLGVGFGQFAWHHFDYQATITAHPEVGLTNHAHNLPLHLLAETGAIGATLVVGAAVHWLAGLRRLRIDVDHGWLLAALSVIAVHSLLEYPLWYTFFLGMAAVIVGLTNTRSIRVGLGRVGAPLAGLVLIAGLVQAALLLRDFRSFEQLVFAVYRSDTDVPAERVFRDVLTGIYREPLLAPYVDTVVAYGVPVTTEKLPEKLAHFDRAARFAPAPFIVYRQAMLLELAGQRAGALEQMKRALRVYPWGAEEFVPELEDLSRRHPEKFASLLELARSVARAPRRSLP
jgi:O-antigen ligase